MKSANVLTFRRPTIDVRLAQSLMRLAAAIEGELEPLTPISRPRVRTPGRPILTLSKRRLVPVVY
jgi:hypothetical protein